MKVLLADDHEVVLKGLRALFIEQDPGAQIFETTNGRDALRIAREEQPDIAVIDVQLPDVLGTEIIKQLRNVSHARVIVLSAHDDPRYVQQAFLSGASAYLLKSDEMAEVTKAADLALRDRTYVSTSLGHLIVQGYLNSVREQQAPEVLTAKERQVLKLLGEGHTRHDVATRLGIDVGTVSSHRASIMRKLGLESASQLTAYAIREGIVKQETLFRGSAGKPKA
ncbi:response regulator transcription factor [bacterium]|nr:response regulator transcription factor [bacterium]